MKKKTIAALLAATLVLSPAMGCSSPSGESAAPGSAPASAADDGGGEAQPSGEATPFTFWTYVEQHTEFFIDAADTWNAAHPEEPIELSTETYPVPDMHSKLLVTLQSGDGAPDIVDVNVARFSDFMQEGEEVFVPLNDIIEPEKEHFLEPVLDIYKYNGNYYGLEYHVGAPTIFYNTEILGEAGVKPEDIVTWEDFHEAGKKVLEATGKPMITFDVSDMWQSYIMMCMNGGDYFDADGNCIINSEENAEVLQFMLDMLADGTAVTTPGGSIHTEEFYGYMAQGGTASLLECFWYLNRFTDYMTELSGKVAVASPPVWEEGNTYPVFGGTGTAITVQCENQDLAKRFLAEAKTSEEGAGKIWTVLGFDPLRWDVWDTDVTKEQNKFTDYFGEDIFDVVLSMKDGYQKSNITASPKFSAASNLVNSNLLFQVLSEKSASPQDALNAIAQEIENTQ